MEGEYCPIGKDQVDENVVRIVAIIVLVFVFLGSFLNSSLVFLFLGLDFGSRAFLKGKFSPLKFLASKISKFLKKSPKMINAEPKKFAAIVGTLFSFLLCFAILFQLKSAKIVLSIVFVGCAFLEGVFGFCVGCEVFQMLVKLNIIK